METARNRNLLLVSFCGICSDNRGLMARHAIEPAGDSGAAQARALTSSIPLQNAGVVVTPCKTPALGGGAPDPAAEDQGRKLFLEDGREMAALSDRMKWRIACRNHRLANRAWVWFKTKLKWIPVAGMAMLLGGCAAALPFLPVSSLLPSGSASADFRSATTVKLEQANFTTVRTNVVGQSKGFALVGIITLVPARFSTAMDRLYTRAEMRPGRAQTLANVVVERSSSYFILYSIPRVSVRADVVEFVLLCATPVDRRVQSHFHGDWI